MLMKVVNLCPIRRIWRDFKTDDRQNGTRTPNVNKAKIREKNWRWWVGKREHCLEQWLFCTNRTVCCMWCDRSRHSKCIYSRFLALTPPPPPPPHTFWHTNDTHFYSFSLKTDFCSPITCCLCLDGLKFVWHGVTCLDAIRGRGSE